LHFFDLYKYELNKEPFEPLRPFAPNSANIEALDNILNMLKTDTRFKVVTARELWTIHTKDPNALNGPSFVPYSGLLPTYVRCWKFFFSDSMLPKIVVLTPIVAIGAIAVLVLIWTTRKSRRMTK
jgi:hypothetical protein